MAAVQRSFLAVLVLAAIVTGVAESAAKTAMPKDLIGRWKRGNGVVMVVGPRGKVNISKAEINKAGWYHTRFSRVTAHKHHGRLSFSLSISGPRSCSGTGTYRWTNLFAPLGGPALNLKKIHDACKLRVGLFEASDWGDITD
jgi:hypothetical protein